VSHPDFWLSSGFRLLERRDDGRLVPTDDFLRAYLLRPELEPVEESCPAERALHAALLEMPRRPVTPVNLVRLRDPDARENWQIFARFRDHLLAHASLEEAYLALLGGDNRSVAPLFVDQLVHVLVRAVLDDIDDPLLARAGECLFRSQKATIRDGAVLLADEETVEMHERSGGFGALGRLLVEAETRPRQVELDILTEENAAIYWARSDRFDTVLDISFTRPGLDALCRVLERWLAHLLGVASRIQPLQTVRDERWAWHLGLDAEASAILDELYHGHEVEEARLARLLSLFRLEIRDPELMRAELRGRPVYLGLAMDGAARLRLKPQNLLVNLPLAVAA
jgi:hypothetical protein